jgi:hypothetical protein
VDFSKRLRGTKNQSTCLVLLFSTMCSDSVRSSSVVPCATARVFRGGHAKLIFWSLLFGIMNLHCIVQAHIEPSPAWHVSHNTQQERVLEVLSLSQTGILRGIWAQGRSRTSHARTCHPLLLRQTMPMRELSATNRKKVKQVTV